jgi:hypothetical protein
MDREISFILNRDNELPFCRIERKWLMELV